MQDSAPKANRLPMGSAATLLGAAVALGVAGDLLLRATPWGLNLFVFALLLAAAAVALPRAPGLRRPKSSWWLVPALLFGALFPLRASETVSVLCGLAALLCFLMVSYGAGGTPLRVAGMMRIALHVAIAWLLGLGALALFLAEGIDYREIVPSRKRGPLVAIGRGLLIATPIVLAFGGLFAAADIFFRDFLTDAFAFDAGTAAAHAMITLLVAWLSGSYLAAITLIGSGPPEPPTPPERARLGPVEIGILLGLVNAVFALFVAIQFRYLFGGSGRVESSSTLTFADYARRGFFELVAVAVLTAVLLLAAHWLLAPGRRAWRMFVPLAALLEVLVLVVMVSAFERMRLYMDFYGLTELRLFVTIFMGWLLIVFAWMAATVLRGARDRFALGAMAAALFVVVATAVANPDDLIVRQNIAHAGPDRPLDIDYLLDLGPDGIPTLLANVEDVPESERCRVVEQSRERYGDPAGDWRSWSYGRWRASRSADDGKLDSYCR
ncbi:MAG: DUF4153 domain-containing protein [Dehalococcoidia bacterium]